MADRFGLRLRFALFFAALGFGGIAAVAAALWVGFARHGGPAEGYVIAGIIAGFAILALSAWIGYLFDEHVARPILALSSDLHTRARASVGADIDQQQAKYLGALAPAAHAIHTALSDARDAQEQAVAEQTANINREKALFATLLHDLAEGAVVLTNDNRVMLYNRVAQNLLGDLGLDRPISRFLRSEPLEHALQRLAAKSDRGEARAESFLAATTNGQKFLLGRVSPIISEGKPLGHVLIFHDATEDLSVHAERDHLFNALLEQVRRPAAAVSALLDALQTETDMPGETRASFRSAMQEELNRLHECLRDSSAKYGEVAARHWPMTEVAAQDIFDSLIAQASAEINIKGGEQFLKCDGFAVVSLLGHVLEGLTEDGSRSGIILSAEAHDHEVWLTIEWAGSDAPDGLIDSWVKRPISDAYGQYTGRDVLEGHRTEIWSERSASGYRVVLPLGSGGSPVLAPQDSRPEFYDFNLPDAVAGSDLAARKLSEIPFVVFDTETTGLEPNGTDDIVQIAGVRIVNGRVLRGEVFDTLVNPGRPIPPASTKVHRISDQMVADSPDIVRAGKDFHSFCQGAVLVAHNAPFDMAFLKKYEPRIGARFDHPFLCTVLLSAALFEHTGQHTLDSLAERFGISIPEEHRHTALGDAIATADVFQKMLSVMEAEGIVTLADAIAAEKRMVKIRKQQNY